MWPLFLNWIEKRRKLEDEDSIVKNDPLDTYAKESIGKVVEETAARHFVVGDHNETTPGASSYDIFWSFDTRRDRLISMQRIAAVSGLCYLDEASNMAIHPLFGPWLSFRAVILFHSGDMITNDGDDDLSALSAPDPIPNLLTQEEEANARAFVQKAFDQNTPKDGIVKFLIASRDSVALGREEHRFSDSQLMYHYTKDAKYLQK